MQPGDWDVEFPGKEAEDGGDGSRSTLTWIAAVAVLIVIGAGLASLAIWLSDSPDPPAAVPEVESPTTPAPIPEIEVPATPAPTVQLPEVAELDEVVDDEVSFGRINVALADGTELFMRLPGISDDSEVSLWDQTQFVVDGLAVSVHFESCTNRGYDAPSPNERGQHLQLPEPSIVVLCETYFPLSAVIFSGDDWRPDELEQLDLWLLAMGPDLEATTASLRRHRGPLQAGDLVLFSEGYQDGRITAIERNSGDLAWEQPTEEAMSLLASTDDVVLVAPSKDTVIAIDATNGVERWRTQFGKSASVTGAGAIGEGEWLVTYEFLNEGDPSPPLLARLDALGMTMWAATGREGTDWQHGTPIVSADRIFVRDAPHEWANAGRASVTAYNVESGDLLWRTELDSTSSGLYSDNLAISRNSGSFLIATIPEKDQIIRLDATTGEIEWTAEKPPGRILSVSDVTIRLGTSLSNDQYDVNPANGLLRGLLRPAG